jgi:hypothetical protein
VTTRPLVAAVLEARNLVSALREERKVADIGPVVVSGMLAEQLAKELAAGAALGAVIVSDDPRGVRSPVAIRVVAGHPSEADEAFVRDAESAEIPVVLVQLWPQETWREPYVLSPFVVECKTGEGFPLLKIAGLLATAADDPTSLAARLPVLKDTIEGVTKRDALVRAAFVGATGGSKGAARPILALEQVSLISRLRALEEPKTGKDEQLPVVVGTAAAAIAASYGFREIARATRGILPARFADAGVAAAGTWLIAEVFRRLEARGLV